MAKKTYAEVKESLPGLKDEAKQAKKDLKSFLKSNSLEEGKEYPDNKKWVKIKGLVDKTAKAVTDAEAFMAENKEKKEGKPRSTKYEYPAEITTAAEKKKYRAQQRSAAKAAEKGEKTEKAGKKDKKKEKEVVAEKTEKTSKKDKKEKKEKAAAED